MKMIVVKEESNELVLDFETSDLTIPDLIASVLQENDDVEFAGVTKEHPEVGNARLVVKTGKKRAKDAFIKALEQIDETMSEMKSALSSKAKG